MADVFISHSSKDAAVANALCGILEQNGISCWMAPRNIMPGDDWATAITKAITASKVFIIIYSANSAASTEVPKEIMLASNKHSYIIPYKIDDTLLQENFEYHLGACHWIKADLQRGDYKEEELFAAIQTGLGRAVAPVVPPKNVPVASPAMVSGKSKQNKKLLPIIGISAAVLALVMILMVMLLGKFDTDKPDGDEDVPAVSGEDSRGDTDEDEEASTEAEQEEVSVTAYDMERVTVYTGRNETFSVFGKTYNEGYRFEQWDAWMMFNVEDCSEVSFTVARIDETADSDREITIYLDGQEYDYYTVSTEASQEITVPLSGAKIMRIEATGGSSAPELGFYDMKFFASSSGEESPTNSLEGDVGEGDVIAVYPYDSERITTYDGKRETFQMFGVTYNEGYVTEQYDSWISFPVKDCTEVVFHVARIDESPKESRELYVYLDGVEYDYYTVEPEASMEIVVPVADATVMRIVCPGGGSAPMLGIYDLIFRGTASEAEEEQALKLFAYDGDRHTLYAGGREQFQVFGEAHSQGYTLSEYDAWMQFNVNGYTEISFTAGRVDASGFTERELVVYLDDKEVAYYTILPEVTQQITVPVDGARTMRIVAEGNGSQLQLGLFDFKYSGVYEPLYPESLVEMELRPYDAERLTVYDMAKEGFRMFDEEHVNGFVMSEYDSWALFNVNGYTEITFQVGRIDKTAFTTRDINIELDGKLWNSFEVTTDEAQTITVPVDGVKTMRIVAEGNGSVPQLGLFDFVCNGAYEPMYPQSDAKMELLPYDEERLTVYQNASEGFFVFGEEHTKGFVLSEYDSWVLFNVNGYTEITFTVGRIDKTALGSRELYIYLDGKQVSHYAIDSLAAETITVPLNGAKIMRIVTEGNGSVPQLGLFDFVCSGTYKLMYPEAEGLSVLTAYDGSRMTPYDAGIDTFLVWGEAHDKGVVLSEYESWAMFNVNGYTSCSFTVGRVDGLSLKERNVTIYLDGELYDTFTVLPEEPKEITIPLEHVTVMRIYVEGNGSVPQLGFFNFSLTGTYVPLKRAQVADGVYGPEQLQLQDSVNVEEYKDKGFEICGETHELGYVSKQYHEFSLSFDATGYTQFHFIAGCIDGGSFEARKITVYVDGVEQISYMIYPDKAPVEVTLPVNGGVVEIRGAEGDGNSPLIGFFDVYVTKK